MFHSKVKSLLLVVFLILAALPLSCTEGSISLPEEHSRSRGTVVVNATGTGDYKLIQEAIDDASIGDIIYVDPGLYIDNVVISKTIQLIGAGKEYTTIYGRSKGTVVTIYEDEVKFSGFNITNYYARSNSDSGIKVYNAHYCTIENNSCNGFNNGISISSANFNIVKNNVCIDNDLGIYIYSSKGNDIKNNICESNEDGIFISSSNNNNTIDNNVCNQNNDDGIYLGIPWYESSSIDNNSIVNNTCILNGGKGIYIDGSSYGNCNYNRIINNNCSLNEDDGIYLSVAYNTEIRNNLCHLNDGYGISIWKCSNNVLIANNSLLKNDNDGIHIYSSSNITIIDNEMVDCGLFIDDSDLKRWDMYTIDRSNTINGKPIVFLKNQIDGNVTPDAGQVILVNCTNVEVIGQNISNCYYAIFALYSENITISDNICNYNDYGIYTFESTKSIITNNSCEYNIYGIYTIESTNNIISNNICNFNNWTTYYGSYYGNGIKLVSSDNNSVVNNTCLENYEAGITVSNSENNKINNNTVSSSNYGIYLSKSTNSSILNNSMIGGIYLSYSLLTVLSNNNMTDWGVFFSGDTVEHWNTHSIDLSNTVCNRSIYYWKNTQERTVPNDVGQIILANCTGVVIENQEIHETIAGIQIAYSYDNIITSNNCTNNGYGIYLFSSNGNIISYNNCSSNYGSGCKIDISNENTLISNTCDSNGNNGQGNGIALYHSDQNIARNNTVQSNVCNGIELESCDENLITRNVCSFNQENGISLESCDISGEGTVENNTCNSNLNGISIFSTNYNSISNNTCNSNEYDGIILSNSGNINVMNNTFAFNKGNGMKIDYNSPGNFISLNTFRSNNGYGIEIDDRYCGGNFIHHNIFIGNNNNGTQACDMDGKNHWDDVSYGEDVPREGNYWSDWTSPDEDRDFIVDLPYPIDGGNDRKDRFPLVLPLGSPGAHAGDDLIVHENTLVRFNSSKCRDDKGIVNYTWTFVYDGTEVFLYGAAPEFTFGKNGKYLVDLTVTDGEGNVAFDNMTVTVEETEEIDEDIVTITLAIAIVILIVLVLMRKFRKA